MHLSLSIQDSTINLDPTDIPLRSNNVSSSSYQSSSKKSGIGPAFEILSSKFLRLEQEIIEERRKRDWEAVLHQPEKEERGRLLLVIII